MAETPPLTEVIAGLEDQTWKVLSKDGTGFLPFLSEDCILQFPYGMSISAGTEPSIKDVMTSDAFVPWKSYTLSNVIVTPIGLEGAVISYKVRASRPDAEGKDERFRALICSVWRKDPATGAWQMCFHQQTPFDQSIEDIA